MQTLLIYLLKSIACSGILFAYYRIAFYQRSHHQWNRVFLLGAVALSLLLPLLIIHVPWQSALEGPYMVRLMNVVTTNARMHEELPGSKSATFNWALLLAPIYAFVSLSLLALLAKALLRIRAIYTASPKCKWAEYEMAMTEEKDAPFSFMKVIFWNRRLELDSTIGARILQHEIGHVQMWHSIDRLFVNIVVALFWCNPFFWLIRRELIMVHEFQADQRAIKKNDAEAFSEMVLLSTFSARHFGVASTFFTSSIKRRLTMITTFHQSRSSLFVKWLILPLVLIMIASFSMRKTAPSNLQSTFVVMIDAGHGGSRSGVIAEDGTKEKDINLSIAKKIRELNTSDRIKVLMTREGDEDAPLRERVENARRQNVNAFLSIHINRDESSQSGIQLMMTKNANEYSEKSRLLGSLLSHELGKVFKVDGELRKGSGQGGVWVLDAPEINYPSLLIECGNLNNPDDLAFIKSDDNQRKIARQILSALVHFAEGADASGK
jgi:N-acetylmuramoyl-L-alanine amidase